MSTSLRTLTLSVVLCLGCVAGLHPPIRAAERPNILWITSEDNSPYLGCYGDSLAQTPHIDRLAEQGVRYRHAFANAPVCSTARTTLVTGMYACSLGAQNHRSRVRIPDQFPLYPEVLREAGYYCTNNSKTDYNLADRASPWDASSPQAHYRNRAAGQPFFAVFNSTLSHESQVSPRAGKTPDSFRVAPEQIVLPPYHPETPEIRRDWANYYDQLTLMDAQVGKWLDELEQLGLADETIVFYYSDHGGALPGGKRSIHDSGTRVPLIIRFPEKWSHLAPVVAGEWCDDLVSFVDFPATLCCLAGVDVPANYQGVPFLGSQKGPPREHVFLFRGRMDERYDTVRAIRDEQFRYVRNYNPELPWGQPYSYPFQVQASMRSWYDAFLSAGCNPAQSRYWLPKPAEELYDLATDPFEQQNLAADSRQSERLAVMRQKLDAEMLAIRDVGLIPEGMFGELAGTSTIYEFAHSDAYQLEALLPLANRAVAGLDAEQFEPFLTDANPLTRYWGAVGIHLADEWADSTEAALTGLLQDASLDVRVVAAESLAERAEFQDSLPTLAHVINAGNLYESLAALNALDRLSDVAGTMTRADAAKLLTRESYPEPASRIANRLRNEFP